MQSFSEFVLDEKIKLQPNKPLKVDDGQFKHGTRVMIHTGEGKTRQGVYQGTVSKTHHRVLMDDTGKYAHFRVENTGIADVSGKGEGRWESPTKKSKK